MTGLSDILSAVTSIFTSAVGWMTDVGEAIVANPVLLIFTVLPLVGLGVGLFKRLAGN